MESWVVPYKLKVMESSGPKRTTGVHQSDIIRNLALRGKILDQKWADSVKCGCGEVFNELTIGNHQCIRKASAQVLKSLNPERTELGIAWEERLSRHHPEICFHPGEILVDGISMTIDGASFVDESPSIFHSCGGAVHEFKLTWKSCRNGVEDEWMWMAQTKGYLQGLSQENNEKLRIAFIHVFWVNGNYSRKENDPEGGPVYRIYGLKFTDLEVKENWQMILAHRDRMYGKVSTTRVSLLGGK